MTDYSESAMVEVSRQTHLLGFVYRIKFADGTCTIQFRWYRVGLFFTTLVLLAWLLVAGALHAFFKYKRDFPEVAYTDMLFLPLKMQAHRKKMGYYHIKKGQDFLKLKKFGDAFRLLRLGLINAPGHLEARILVAGIYRSGLSRPDLGVDVAMRGFDFGGAEDAEFLKQLFALLSSEERDDEIRQIASRYLPDEPNVNNLNKIIAFAAANASYHRGHYDQAESLLVDYKLTSSLEGLLLVFRTKWARGEKRETIENLEAIHRRHPKSDEVMQFLGSIYIEEERYDRARQYALLRGLNDPSSFEPKMDLLKIMAADDTASDLSEPFERLLNAYGSDQVARSSLAEFAAQSGLFRQSLLLYREAPEDDPDKGLLAILLVRAYLTAAEYNQAIEFANELYNLSERMRLHLEASLSYAHYALNQDSQGEYHLKSFLQLASENARDYLQLARDLKSIDCNELALKLLKMALEKDAKDQAIIAEAIELELGLEHIESIRQLLQPYLLTRRPDRNLLKKCYNTLISDRFIFEQDRDRLLASLRTYL